MADELTTGAMIDQIEAEMVASGRKIDFRTEDAFVPGLYCRTTFLPKNSLVTSMEHKTEHFFVILKGKIQVQSENEGLVLYEGPCRGITLPGTRRILHALEDTVWMTFHVTEETDVEKIAGQILEPHSNPLIPEESRNQWKEAVCLGSR